MQKIIKRNKNIFNKKYDDIDMNEVISNNKNIYLILPEIKNNKESFNIIDLLNKIIKK
jgi:hypothetical protein